METVTLTLSSLLLHSEDITKYPISKISSLTKIKIQPSTFPKKHTW